VGVLYLQLLIDYLERVDDKVVGDRILTVGQLMLDIQTQMGR